MSSDPTIGIRTVGRYQILQELGRGAMGIVYKGHDPVIGRTVALKTILIKDTEVDDPMNLRQRLYREACAAGTLAHPNIVTIYDVIEERGMTAVAMEFIEGQTLKDLIADRAPLPLDFALDIFEQIAAALDYASLKNIVHRDIKPANIMVTSDGRVKVADFGLARLPASNLTKGSAIMGTPSYMSPEQARGRRLDGRSDVFSATVVLYEMVTKAKPFAGRNLAETLDKIANSPPTPPGQYNTAITPAVTAVFERAFAKDPDARYKSGGEVAGAMREAAGPRAPTVDPNAKTVLMDAAETVLVDPAGFPAAAPPVKTAAMPPPAFDPVLRRHPVEAQAAKPASSRLPIALGGVAAALVVVGIGITLAMRGSATRAAPPAPPAAAGEPAARPGASIGSAASARGDATSTAPPTQPAAPPTERTTIPPAPALGRTAGAVTDLDAGRRSDGRRSGRRAGSELAEEPRSARAAPTTASLQFTYGGAPFPFTLTADGRQIGHVTDAQTMVTIDAGRIHLRAVSDQIYLDEDLGTITLSGGERRTLTLPATVAVFVGVRGENYSGLRILLDGRVVPGPYPAQLPRVAAGKHRIEFRWSEGVLQGVALTDTIDLTDGRQFTVRAMPEAGQVAVQKLR